MCFVRSERNRQPFPFNRTPFAARQRARGAGRDTSVPTNSEAQQSATENPVASHERPSVVEAIGCSSPLLNKLACGCRQRRTSSWSSGCACTDPHGQIKRRPFTGDVVVQIRK